MKKIESLTQEQKNRFPEFVKKWTDIGLSTEPVNRKEAEDGVIEAYRIAGLKAPKIVWCGSPLSMGITRAIILGNSVRSSVRYSVRDSVWDSVGDSVRSSVRDSVGDSVRSSVMASVGDSVGDSVRSSVMASVMASVRYSVRDSVWDSVGDSVRSSVRDSVWDSVRSSVMASVGDSVGDSVRSSVMASVGDSVGDSVRASVGDSVGDSVRSSVRASVMASVMDSVGASVWDSVRDYIVASVRASVGASVMDSVGASVWDSVRDSVLVSGYGQHDAGWLSFYDYFRLACKLESETDRLTGIFKISKNAGWWLPHEKICWISERPNVLHLNKQGRLHADGMMAIQYPDGWGIYALNGVRVPDWLVTTKETELNIDKFNELKNADVKAEFIRKYGIDRMKSKGKLIDSWKNYKDEWYEKSEYELIDMSPIFTNLTYAPYLSMKNQSVEGVFHMEAVPRTVKTVDEAVAFRIKSKTAKIINIK